MNTDEGSLIFWRRLEPKLKSIENDDKLKELKDIRAKKPTKKDKKQTKGTSTEREVKKENKTIGR